MNRFLVYALAAFLALAGLLSENRPADAAGAKSMTLPQPDKAGGKPLMEALALRRSERALKPDPLSRQELSDLLWATWGANRPDGKRTAPTGHNKQDVAVYVVLESGVWLYDGKQHKLELALDQDYRDKFGNPPVTLLYAAPERDEFAPMHVGSLYQNAGLYCASAGLGNTVKYSVVSVLDGLLSLPAGYKVYVGQTIGRIAGKS